jgi:FKBP-type peptidyl-prolyl cis-trans isomerase FkpA
MKLGKYIYLVLIAFLVIGFASCGKTTSQEMRDAERDLLSKYIKKYHKGAYPTASGLYYIETKKGVGDSVVSGNYVKVFYRGYLIEDNDTVGIQDGYLFDASGNYEPFGFTSGAGSVVAGWEEAITLMKQGGEAKWILPSNLAYGGNPQNSIPAYSNLVFYVTLVKIYKSTDTFKVIQKLPRELDILSH